MIVGAGIGGLTTALCLHAAGFSEIRVVETARELRPLGVGLNILPNAVRVLCELGLEERLSANVIRTAELALYNRHGDLIWSEPRGLSAGHRWPQWSIHRGHLQSVLADAVRSRLGHESIVLDSRLLRCRPAAENRVALDLHSRAADAVTSMVADVVVGADGIRSAVRAGLYPDEGPPPGNGMVMWRGTTWTEPFLTGSSMIVTGDDRQRVVLYPISRDPESGRVLVNWVTGRPWDDDDPSARGDWHRQVPVSKVLRHFGEWRFDWLEVGTILAGAGQVHEYPIVDRDPLPQWTFGHITLLGDAAHAMYPMGSNGATQSIVDAQVLAKALATGDDPGEALRHYEDQRRPVTAGLQASNRRMGPEIVIDIAHQRAPNGFTNIEDVIPAAELAEISNRYAATGRFDVAAVDAQQPVHTRAKTESRQS
ncbi:flavin-dependent oxidoreductase [Amycolatopsis pigmentata]|uniref:Flavin-dependent oxidoreductase n=1 Tax=Amycolatopsis pigmentata TaxID=450801 RepID=A0ABW5FRG5_9PSEU